MRGKIAVVAILAGLCVLLGACSAPQKEYLPKPIDVSETVYRTYTVTRETLERAVNENGSLAVMEYEGQLCAVAEYNGVNRSVFRLGDRLELTCGGKTYPGRVISLYESISSPLRILFETTPTWVGRILFNTTTDQENVWLGMNVRISGVAERKENVVSLPKAYVKKQNDGTGLVRVLRKNENGSMEKIRVVVTIGMETTSRYEITNGLSSGDLVVID
ncbi:MAG: hypothetical protein KIG36_02440 [Eubacteriales bacterium]|nr:hypothetical protein [Eubacteriales bacterium]